ncbi:MAG: taurine ABC transporter permease, partial [Roseiarcus sp.]
MSNTSVSSVAPPERLPHPIAPRRAARRLTYVGKVAIATCLAVVLLWWAAARLEVVPAMFLPSPQAVAAKLVAVSTDGFEGATLQQHLLASVGRVLAALAAAIVTGVILGFSMNLSRTARGVIEPL